MIHKQNHWPQPGISAQSYQCPLKMITEARGTNTLPSLSPTVHHIPQMRNRRCWELQLLLFQSLSPHPHSGNLNRADRHRLAHCSYKGMITHPKCSLQPIGVHPLPQSKEIRSKTNIGEKKLLRSKSLHQNQLQMTCGHSTARQESKSLPSISDEMENYTSDFNHTANHLEEMTSFGTHVKQPLIPPSQCQDDPKRRHSKITSLIAQVSAAQSEWLSTARTTHRNRRISNLSSSFSKILHFQKS